VTTEALLTTVSTFRREDRCKRETTIEAVRVHICRVRKRVEPLGVKIINRYGSYAIDELTRQRIKRILLVYDKNNKLYLPGT
jgi:hypothetical protein